MDKTEVEQALIERSRIAGQLAEINAGYDAMLRRILTPELQAELDAINAERTATTKESTEKLADLELQIKTAVIEMKETVKVPGVAMAVYTKGRVTWDSKGLDGLMVAVPQLAQFRKEGDPSVAIRGA